MEKLKSSKVNELISEKLIENFNNEQLLEFTKNILSYNEKKAVLGIDIYRYSQYSQVPQMLIPHLFKYLYDLTVKNCLDHEPIIFKDCSADKDFKKLFIDTGDGGFQILQNPFQAIVFLIYFQSNVVRYNSDYKLTKELYDIIGEITLRYTLTYDDIYSYESNYFGPAIINCARIISKDKLNRFLIDENSKFWFSKELNSIENLAYLELEEDIEFLKFISFDDSDVFKSIIFDSETPKIKHVDLMKIGEIKAKLDTLSIYNLHIQTLMYSHDSKFKKIAITIGNLNSNGLDV